MKAVLLRRDDPLSWSLMPAVCDRIRRFCETVGADAPAEMMIQALQVQFVLERPEVICIVAVNEDGIMGHLLANLEHWGGKVHAHVLQLEIDDQSVPVAQKLAAFRMLIGWARDHGAAGIQAFIPEKYFDRLGFWKRMGFAQKYVVMRRPLDPLDLVSARTEEVGDALAATVQNARGL